MFQLNSTNTTDITHYIQDDSEWKRFLHSDGSVYRTVEYFPTREQAQAVLDKFQPKHVWKHGDVFETKTGGTIMVYLIVADGPVVYVLDYSGPGKGTVDYCLKDATFLFNIKTVIKDKL